MDQETSSTLQQPPTAPTFNQLTEFFQQFDEHEARNVIQSITYNVASQTFVIKIRDLLRREEENIEANRTQARAPEKNWAAEEIRKLSSSFAHKFPQLLQHYRAWVPFRKDLIKETKTCADKLERNFTFMSVSRIFTSSADLFGTWRRRMGSTSSLVQLALENARAFNFVTHFLQMTLSKQMHYKIAKLLEEDQELFQPIKQWFQMSRDLDDAVKTFFPYGIDQKLALKIHKSAENSDEYSKIFMSVIASNAKNDIKLIKDKEFLDNADMFSTSEVGVKWYRKVLVENDPVYTDCFKSELEDEINTLRKKMENTSAIDHSELLVDTLLLNNRVRTKVILNGLSIFSAFSSIWDNGKYEESRTMRKMSEKIEKELKAMKEILVLLRPEGTEIDEYLV